MEEGRGFRVADDLLPLRVPGELERQAARFGLQLLHESGIRRLDAWFADFAETDWRYVEAFYRTGAVPAWGSCVVLGAPLVEPLAIPPLRPRPVGVRYAF